MRCANCNSTTHTADSKLCEVYLVIKNKAINASSTRRPNIIDELITANNNWS